MRKTESQALDFVTDKSPYGSLDELAFEMVSEQPGLIKGDIDFPKMAKALELPEWVVRRVVHSVAFKNVLRIAAVNANWTLWDEVQHVERVKDIAISDKAGIDALAKSREHIAKLQGTPLDDAKRDTIVPIQIVFELPAQPQLAAQSPGALKVHQPKTAGDLPPPGIRAELAERGGSHSKVHGVDVGSDLDFYSDEAREPGEAEPVTIEVGS